MIRNFPEMPFASEKGLPYTMAIILISANMEKLTRYLEVPEDKIRSKGIESIRSRVVNLCEYNPGLDIPSMIQGPDKII